MTPDGKVKSEFTPKFPDARIVGKIGDIQSSPDGRLWTSDGDCLVRLDDNGTVDLILGNAPQTDVLGRVAGVAVDSEGQIYAVDERTGSVHVFSKSGKPMHVCQARPTDFPGDVFNPPLTINLRGEVFLGLGDNSLNSGHSRQFAHFNDKGERLGELTLPNARCQVQPKTGNVIAMRYNDILMFDQQRKLARIITRRPDGNWLNDLQLALGADGTVAVLSDNTVNI